MFIPRSPLGKSLLNPENPASSALGREVLSFTAKQQKLPARIPIINCFSEKIMGFYCIAL
jgi:hypothetical protein